MHSRRSLKIVSGLIPLKNKFGRFRSGTGVFNINSPNTHIPGLTGYKNFSG